MPIRPFSIALILLMSLWITMSSHAQDNTNLLQNPGFNQSSSYVDQRPAGSAYDFAIAPGWNGWQTRSPSTESWMNIEPIAFPHTGSSRREGEASQNVGRGDATFTAAVYQTVSGIAEGTTLRFRVWVLQDSDAGSGSQTRVGIGSNVGGNPLGSPITWSPWMRAIDSWQQVTVDATVPAGSVTVFIYSTQSQPKPGNQNYYDDAVLSVLSGDGQVNVGEGQQATGTVAPPAPPTSTPRTFAPFVSAQATQESGEITHTVQSGDTLAAIAVAYGVPASQILELNNLTREQARFIRVGQQLIIREASPQATDSDNNDDDDDDTSAAETTEQADETEAVEAESTEDNSEAAGFASPTALETKEVASPTATAIPTETDIPTEVMSPTPTLIPATATQAPPAPVEEGDDGDPLAIDTGVCVLMFDDRNQNNVQNDDDTLLSGGTIMLDINQDDTQEYITDGSEPFCFDELDAGLYTMRATAPDGYGLSSAVRSVNVQAGQVFTVRFAAVEGLEVAVAPTTVPSAMQETTPEALIEDPVTPSNNLRNIAGIIVLGLAGVILAGGIGVGLLMRGR